MAFYFTPELGGAHRSGRIKSYGSYRLVIAKKYFNPVRLEMVWFVIFRCSIIMGQVKSEFVDGNFYHAFTVVDHDFPLDGDAKVAMSVLCGRTSNLRREIFWQKRKLMSGSSSKPGRLVLSAM